MSITNIALTVMAVLLFSLTPRPALAQTNNQITLNKDSGCYEFGDYKYCSSYKSIQIETSPNNGGLNTLSLYRVCISSTNITTGQILSEYCSRFKYHTLYNDDLSIKEQGDQVYTSSTFGEITCTYNGAYHFAGNEVQFDKTSFICS